MPIAYQTTETLRSGERISRDEFLRRAEASELKHVELIGGCVHIMAPPSEPHSDYQALLGHLLVTYARRTRGCKANVEVTVCIGDDAPEADGCLRIREECGGASHSRAIGETVYIHGSPELVAEISFSSAHHDLRTKPELYRANGVKEYVVVLGATQEFRWHRLVKGAYKVVPMPADGIYRSRVFPGLWIKAAAFFAEDDLSLEATLQAGLASPEHAAFVSQLQRRKR